MVPFAIATQAAMIAGFARHALRSTRTETLDDQPSWAKAVYPAGIILLLVIQVLLGIFGWEGAQQIGNWIPALLASLLTLGLFIATRRFRIFNPTRAHWVASESPRINNPYQGLWSIYRWLARTVQTVTNTLEGEGGIMWTLLFLALFVLVIVGGLR
jgi:hypothetical protein